MAKQCTHSLDRHTIFSGPLKIAKIVLNIKNQAYMSGILRIKPI